LITTKTTKHGDSYKASLLPWYGNKKGKNLDSYTFIHLFPENAKVDHPQENKAKTRRSTDLTWTNKGGQSYIGCKLHCI
jgi:hypothetical protein